MAFSLFLHQSHPAFFRCTTSTQRLCWQSGTALRISLLDLRFISKLNFSTDYVYVFFGSQLPWGIHRTVSLLFELVCAFSVYPSFACLGCINKQHSIIRVVAEAIFVILYPYTCDVLIWFALQFIVKTCQQTNTYSLSVSLNLTLCLSLCLSLMLKLRFT